MTNIHGINLRREVENNEQVAFTGVYDVFSATIAAKYSRSLFLSGFGFAASYYGLPDIGFIAWTDMVQFVQRIRAVLPEHDLLVDIDDGYGDPEVAAHVALQMERAGASGVVLEDQQRPRRCGHFDGKQIMPLDEYLVKLRRVLNARKDLFVVARTDSSDPQDVLQRVKAFAEEGADAVLVDGLRDMELIREVKAAAKVPVTFNQIAGGKSPACTLQELKDFGVSLVIYSTPCLFAAQSAMEAALERLSIYDGRLTEPDAPMRPIGVADCTSVLAQNISGRNGLASGELNASPLN